MSGKIYSLIFFIGLFWFFCLYVGFKNEKKIVSPVDFFLFGRQLPGWSYAAIFTSTIFALWIFFIHYYRVSHIYLTNIFSFHPGLSDYLLSCSE